MFRCPICAGFAELQCRRHINCKTAFLTVVWGLILYCVGMKMTGSYWFQLGYFWFAVLLSTRSRYKWRKQFHWLKDGYCLLSLTSSSCVSAWIAHCLGQDADPFISFRWMLHFQHRGWGTLNIALILLPLKSTLKIPLTYRMPEMLVLLIWLLLEHMGVLWITKEKGWSKIL